MKFIVFIESDFKSYKEFEEYVLDTVAKQNKVKLKWSNTKSHFWMDKGTEVGKVRTRAGNIIQARGLLRIMNSWFEIV